MTALVVTYYAPFLLPGVVSALVVTVSALTVLVPAAVVTLIAADYTVSKHKHATVILGARLTAEGTGRILPGDVIALKRAYCTIVSRPRGMLAFIHTVDAGAEIPDGVLTRHTAVLALTVFPLVVEAGITAFFAGSVGVRAMGAGCHTVVAEAVNPRVLACACAVKTLAAYVEVLTHLAAYGAYALEPLVVIALDVTYGAIAVHI